MSLFKKLRQVMNTTPMESGGSGDEADRQLNYYIEAANEQLRAFHAEVQRTKAQGISLERKIADLEDFITHYHDQAKRALENGDESEARRWLEEKRNAADTQNTLRQQLAEISQLARQLESQYARLEERVERVRATRDALADKRHRAEAQSDVFSAIGDLNLHNPKADFDQLRKDVERVEARAEAEYELNFGNGEDDLSAEIRKLKEAADRDEHPR